MSALRRMGIPALVLPVLLGACRPEANSRAPDAASAPTSADAPADAGAPANADDEAADASMAAHGPRQRPPPPPIHGRDQALAAVAAGHPERAAEVLAEHLREHPDDHAAVLELARARRITGELAEAERLLAGLRGKLGNIVAECEVLRRRADLAELRGDAKSAQERLEEALKLAPADLTNRGRYLAFLVARGRADEPATKALIDELYDAYGAGAAKTAAELLAIARATLATGTHGGFKDANTVLTEAEELEPASGGSELADELLLLHAEVFRRKYASDAAIETLDLLLQRDPFNPDALALLGHVQIDELALADASRSAQEALATNPRHADAHALLARIALVEGRRVEARRRVDDEVLTVHPHHVEGLSVLAAVAQFEGDDKGYASARDRALADNPKSADFYLGLADSLAFLHLYVESDTVLREGIARVGERDPFLQSAFGLNALRLGHEDEGRAAIDRAWKGDRSNERTLNTRKLYAERIGPHYVDRVHGDLSLRLPSEQATWVDEGFAAAVRRARDHLDAAYGIHPAPMRVEIFDDADDFSIRTVGTPSLGALAVCFGPVITAIGPYGGQINFDQVIWHELSHTYAIQISRGRVPRWFTEGLSEWESELADPAWARESAELLREARRRGKTRALHELELAFLRAESPLMMEVAYATAAYAMRYLGTTYGRPALIRMLAGYGRGQTSEELFLAVLGKDIATVEREFELWFAQELAHRIGGWIPRATVDGDTVVGEDRPAAAEDPRDALFRAALQDLQHNDADAASRKLEQLIAKGGDGYATRFTLARSLMEGPGRASAVKHLEKAAEFHTEATEPLAMLARLANERGDLEGEMEALARALRIDAMTVDPAARLLMLATVADDTRRRELALTRLRSLAPLHPITLAGQALELTSARAKPQTRARAQALVEEASRLLAGGEGPVDSLVVAALAAASTGDDERRSALAKRALAGKLPAAARKRMEALAR